MESVEAGWIYEEADLGPRDPSHNILTDAQVLFRSQVPLEFTANVHADTADVKSLHIIHTYLTQKSAYIESMIVDCTCRNFSSCRHHWTIDRGDECSRQLEPQIESGDEIVAQENSASSDSQK
jgi:hypothetical protein